MHACILLGHVHLNYITYIYTGTYHNYYIQGGDTPLYRVLLSLSIVKF